MEHLAKKRLKPAERLGAHLAYLLNASEGEGSVVKLSPWALERQLIETLVSNRALLFGLVGVNELGLSPPAPNTKYRRDRIDTQFQDAERGAELWLAAVLDRVLQLTKSDAIQNGHRLLSSLAARGVDWPAFELVRSDEASAADGGELDRAVRGVFDRLQRQMETVQGKPQLSAKARKEQGPLWLKVSEAATEVPDGLSLWGAIRCAPGTLSTLDNDAELDLIHFMIRAVHSANKHWERLKDLNLSPADWISMDDWEEEKSQDLSRLTINQAGEACKFRNEAISLAQAAGRDSPDMSDFEIAWSRKPILKTIDFETFKTTPVGRALISNWNRDQIVALPDPDSLDAQAELPPPSSAEDAMSVLALLEQQELLSALDVRIFRAVLEQEDLASLHARDTEIQFAFPDFSDLAEHSENLAERIAETVLRLNE